MSKGEHSLAGSAIHQAYVKLIEERLLQPLAKHGKTVDQFFDICSKIQKAGHADEIEPFLNVLLAASDYLLFADIMSDEGKRSYFFVILRGLQNQYKRELDLVTEEQQRSGKEDEGKSASKSNSKK